MQSRFPLRWPPRHARLRRAIPPRPDARRSAACAAPSFARQKKRTLVSGRAPLLPTGKTSARSASIIRRPRPPTLPEPTARPPNQALLRSMDQTIPPRTLATHRSVPRSPAVDSTARRPRRVGQQALGMSSRTLPVGASRFPHLSVTPTRHGRSGVPRGFCPPQIPPALLTGPTEHPPSPHDQSDFFHYAPGRVP